MAEQTPVPQTALAKRVVTVREWVQTQLPELHKAVPRGIDPVRLARVALTTIINNPKLLDCSRESLIACLMQTAAWGLSLDPVLGEAYMVPFMEKGHRLAKLIIGYQGLITLARRSGDVRKVTPRVVHALDRFDYEYGLEERCIHKPYDGPDDPGPLTHAYAVITLADGSKDFDVMEKRTVDTVRSRSRAANDGPWVTDYEAMAKKSVIRRILKYASKSTELAQAIRLDEMVDAGEDQLPMMMPVDAQVEVEKPKRGKLDRLTDALKKPEPLPEASTPPTPEQEAAALDAELFGEEQ